MSWMFKGLVFLLPFLFIGYVSTSVFHDHSALQIRRGNRDNLGIING